MSKIQAVLFDKDMYNTSKARYWMKSHDIQPIKRVHETKRYYRYRINDPKDFNRFRTKLIDSGVKFIFGYI